MDQELKLSVVIPVYNASATIVPCLNSIYSSTYNNIEVIVVDDASFDNGVELIKHYPVIIVRNEKNQGPSFSRNRGVEAASGDVVVYLDADIVLPRKDSLIKIINYFNANKNVSALTGRYCPNQLNLSLFSDYKNIYMNFIAEEQDVEVNFLLGAICAVRKEDVQKWNEDIRFGEDSQMGQDMVKEGKSIHLLKDLEVIHLKTYTFLTFFKNSFIISFNFTKLFIRNKGWLQYQKGSFSHVSLRQLFSILSAFIVALLAIISIKLLVVGVCLFSAINFKYLIFVLRKSNVRFLFISVVIHFIDNLIMGVAIFCSLVCSFF